MHCAGLQGYLSIDSFHCVTFYVESSWCGQATDGRSVEHYARESEEWAWGMSINHNKAMDGKAMHMEQHVKHGDVLECYLFVGANMLYCLFLLTKDDRKSKK